MAVTSLPCLLNPFAVQYIPNLWAAFVECTRNDVCSAFDANLRLWTVTGVRTGDAPFQCDGVYIKMGQYAFTLQKLGYTCLHNENISTLDAHDNSAFLFCPLNYAPPNSIQDFPDGFLDSVSLLQVRVMPISKRWSSRASLGAASLLWQQAP